MPSSTVEDYLKCIFLHQGDPPAAVATGTIASALDVSPGTVTAMLKTLSASRLIRYTPYEGAFLTDAGRQLAAHVLRRHRLVELFLVQVLGMDWSEVHEEAEHLEHAVSDRLIERIAEMLDHPQVDPHGDPIPSRGGEVASTNHPNLLECPIGVPLVVARVTDQEPPFLRRLEGLGLRPGSACRVAERDAAAEVVEIRLPGGEIGQVGFGAAVKVRVTVVEG